MSVQAVVENLWATKTTWTLHASSTCCGNRGYRSLPRTQVKAHADPSYFDLDRFTPCVAAQKLLADQEQAANVSPSDPPGSLVSPRGEGRA